MHGDDLLYYQYQVLVPGTGTGSICHLNYPYRYLRQVFRGEKHVLWTNAINGMGT